MAKNTGLIINSLFAMPPNRLRLCGSESALTAMESCATGGSCTGVAEEIATFRTMWPYLQLISSVIHTEPLSQKAAECYWLGNPAVFRFRPQHFELLLSYFSCQGEIPERYIDQLREDAPKAFIPFHTFQVLLSARHGGGINEGTLPSINQCMVAWGRVKEVDEATQEVLVTLKQFAISKGKLILETVELRQCYNEAIFPNIKRGNFVICHWDTVVMTISLIRANRLEKVTREILKIQNKI